MKIEDLKISEKEKGILIELSEPKEAAEVAALLDISYNTASTKLKVWFFKEWVKKIKVKKLVKYYLNQDVLEI